MSGKIYLETGGKQTKKIYLKTANGEIEIKKAYSYPGNRNVFSSGHIVVYHIDANNVVNKEVDDGADCVTNAPSATKSGWTFHGWREDTVASSTIIPSKTCNADNIHLYAVFKQTITLSYNGNSATSGSTASQTADRYYNNGNSANASFTLRANGYTRTNYSFAKWAQGSASGTKYSPGATVALSANTTFYAYWVQTVTNYEYTGGMQSYTAPVAGTYTLAVWGGQGAGAYHYQGWLSSGGYGGYSYGNVALAQNQTIYICVGGAASGRTTGGYNGGGNGLQTGYEYSRHSAGGGGGATHIAKTNRGVLSGYNSYRSEVLIVAGGGGGGGDWADYNDANGIGTNGGSGGGTNGGNGGSSSSVESQDPGIGGTQSSGYSFGVGQPSASNDGGYRIGGAGGGGWFGGTIPQLWGYGNGGGGGSGYIGGVSGGSMSNGQRSGNGYARVTFVSAS